MSTMIRGTGFQMPEHTNTAVPGATSTRDSRETLRLQVLNRSYAVSTEYSELLASALRQGLITPRDAILMAAQASSDFLHTVLNTGCYQIFGYRILPLPCSYLNWREPLL